MKLQVFDGNSSLLENHHAQNGEREQTACRGEGQRAKLKKNSKPTEIFWLCHRVGKIYRPA
jgi:hypothetical protein